MSFSAQTLIGALDSQVKVDEIHEGNLILTADPSSQWEEKEVLFSECVKSEGKHPCVQICYNGTEIIVSRSHLFLLENHEFIRADSLSKESTILGKNYTPVKLATVNRIEYVGKLFHISAYREYQNGDINKHLITCNDIICADFQLERSKKQENLMQYF